MIDLEEISRASFGVVIERLKTIGAGPLIDSHKACGISFPLPHCWTRVPRAHTSPNDHAKGAMGQAAKDDMYNSREDCENRTWIAICVIMENSENDS